MVAMSTPDPELVVITVKVAGEPVHRMESQKRNHTHDYKRETTGFLNAEQNRYEISENIRKLVQQKTDEPTRCSLLEPGALGED